MSEENETKTVQEPKKKISKYNPITCPRCGKRAIAFVTEYHKCIGTRIVSYLFGVASIIFAICYILNRGKEGEPPYAVAAIACAILYVVCQIIICLVESRTHISAICRECGHVWTYEIDY